jgi:PAS domain S-box-containing protein
MSKRTSRAKLSAVEQRLQILRNEVALTAQPDRFAAELAALQQALGDLAVAYEEMDQQTEELETAREELERQRHRYMSLFEDAPFGYLVTDAHGVIENANRAAANLLNISPWHLQGKPLFVFLTAPDRSYFRSLLARLRAGETASDREVILKAREREPFAAMLTVMRDHGSPDKGGQLRWSIRDISERKAAQEALRQSEEQLRHSQRLESVGRLAGGIAHSFNNLLAAIAFHSELLCDGLEEDDPRRGHVDRIQKAGERAATLARQLLAFGRKQVLQPRVVSLNEILWSMEPMLRKLIGENIELEVTLSPEAGSLNADLGQLEQVILNLVVNARDAMPYGGRLTLATKNVEISETEAGDRHELSPGPYLEFSVADTGTGIPPEILEHLFEPFFTTKERFHGSGLGLATVHGIVHQSGGHVRVESEAGKGSRFCVLLPRVDQPAEAVPAPRPARAAARGSEIVLLVEDEQNIREPAVEILESRGYQVLAARDGSEALSLAERHKGPIHVLVTDVIMPGLSGSQLAEQLVPQRPEMRVLYISGYPEDAIAHHGVLNPEQNFLQKPFPPGQFLAKIRDVLDGVSSPARVG